MSDENEKSKKLVDVIREIVNRDDSLRQKYTIGEKFRFIKEKLHALLKKVEASEQQEVVEIKQSSEKRHGHVNVYIYLYNAQGLALRSWSKMVTPKILYEHSVNRPIYLEKKQIESFLRSKTNKAHHGFLTISIKEEDIINREAQQDPLGHPLAKIREGSLKFEHLISFSHNGHDYTIDEEGEIIKKEN